MKRIPLHARNGDVRAHVLVDDEDFERLGRYRWSLTTGGRYARRVIGRRHHVLMHREIMGLDPGNPLQVDHINRDGLDNRRSNLRLATVALNAQNRGSLPGSYSRHRGVSWNKNRHKWAAYGAVDGKRRHLGVFSDEDAAARAAADFRAEHMPFSREAIA